MLKEPTLYPLKVSQSQISGKKCPYNLNLNPEKLWKTKKQ